MENLLAKLCSSYSNIAIFLTAIEILFVGAFLVTCCLSCCCCCTLYRPCSKCCDHCCGLNSCCCCCCCDKEDLKNAANSIKNKFVEYVFDKILKKDGKYYIVLNYIAPDRYTNLLFFTVCLLIPIVVLQFWDEFLLEESYDCTENKLTCCFDRIWPTYRLKDCETNNVICYKFAFNIAAATASALGLVSTIAVVILIISFVLLKCSHGKTKPAVEQHAL